jgi:hypothetical protein
LCGSSSTALACVTKISEQCNCTPPSAIPVKNQRKTICSHVKLYVISRHEKYERIVHTWCNVKFGHSCARTIRDNAGRITESVMSGASVFV